MAATVNNSATVINLNVFDTSTTNDIGGAETVTLAEVAAALFPTTNAQQTQTIDSYFWQGWLTLTFAATDQYGHQLLDASGHKIYYTIKGVTPRPGSNYAIQVAQSDQYGTPIESWSNTVTMSGASSTALTSSFEQAVESM